MSKDTIRIGPFDYQVRLVEDLKDGDQKLCGWIRHDDNLILLERNMGSQSAVQTLWHEILHALLNQAGIDEHEERILETLSHGIMAVLRDNEWLARAVQVR